MPPRSFRQWVLAKPVSNNTVTLQHFELRTAPLPEIKDGQALVRIKLFNLHSGTRSRMATDDPAGGRSMTGVGETDRSNYACAEVVASRDKTFREGDVIACQSGWQDYQVISSADESVGYGRANPFVAALNGTNAPMNYVFRPAMVESWTPDVLMDVFGTSGMTAYFGIKACGPILPSDQVLVAGASGSVGAMAAQLAKEKGARVVGLAGGEDRCRWVVDTLGVDACLDYRAPGLDRRLSEAFPDGIDVFSDGVGGELTASAMAVMNRHSRLFSYGSAAEFYAPKQGTPSPGKSLRQRFGVTEEIASLARDKNIKIEAWIVYDFYHERLEAENELSRLMRNGSLRPVNTVTEGLENLPQAIVDLYTRPHAGKAQVRIEPSRT